MYTIDVKLVGLATILFNTWAEEERKAFEAGTSGKKLTEEQRNAIAAKKVYRNEKPNLILPKDNIIAMLLQGSKGAPKLKAPTVYTRIEATVFVERHHGVFNATTFNGIFARVGRQPPGPKGGPCIVRTPYLNEGWELCYRLNVLDHTFPPDILRAVHDYGGLYVGFCGWRPQYGRFRVAEWVVNGYGIPKKDQRIGGKEKKMKR